MRVPSGDTHLDDTLASVEALAAAGRALDAIDALTAVQHRTPDPRFAQALVRLRNEAFGELPTEPGRVAWPPKVRDPFPDVAGIPRIDAAQLDAEALGGGVVHHGALHVRGLVDPSTANRFCRYIDDGLIARDRLVAGDDQDDVGSAFVPFPVGLKHAKGFAAHAFMRTVDLPEALADLVDVYATSGVTEAVTGYLGERPAMIAHKWVLRRQAHGGKLGDMHQDGAFLGEGIRTVNCWITLSDCGPGTGRPGLDLLPRRAAGIIPSGGADTVFSWTISESTVLDTAPEASIASPVFRAGDALFFDELLPHRTAQSRDQEPRYAIESWFVAPSSFPDTWTPVVL